MSASDLLEGVQAAADELERTFAPTPHDEILERLLGEIRPVDFRAIANLRDEKDRLQRRHYHVIVIEQVLEAARRNRWSLCRLHDFIYLYNGAFWKALSEATLTTFLGKAAEKMGADYFDANHHKFRDELLKQFLAVAHLPKPVPPKDTVLVNLQNGTFEISPARQFLRTPHPKDFLTYQLPFAYAPDAPAPMFRAFLNRVLPDPDCQKILAEYLAYIFIKTSVLKLEKVLLLYGTGANGKSVFFEITKALFGRENVSSYSLQSLTDPNGYFRAQLANVLVNYASEINGKLETQYFKALASGEDLEARLPYGQPFTLEDYAKLIFNCNELPHEVEHTPAYFRRFLIIPFEVTIPEDEQDKELSRKIIDSELSGVFNWVLEGLRRLLSQKRFTESTKVVEQLEQFKRQSDNVRMFVEDESWKPSIVHTAQLSVMHSQFRTYCQNSGNIPCALRKFGDRLRNLGFQTKKTNAGQVVYIERAQGTEAEF